MVAPRSIAESVAEVTTAETGNDEPGAGLGDERMSQKPRTGTRSLAASLVLLAIVLTLVAFTGNLSSSWTSDDGVYAVQAKLVREGTWELPQYHPDADPDRAHNVLAHTTVTDRGKAYPYPKQPAWIMAMAWSSRLGGRVVGLHLPAYAGALAAAASAWFLARRLASGIELVAFWAVALSAVLVEATAMWAHTAAAALGGLLALGIVRAARHGLGPIHLAGIAATGMVAVLLRGEGVLAVAAVALALFGAALARRKAGLGRTVSVVLDPVVLLVAGASAWWINRAWIGWILDGEVVSVRSDSLPPSGFVAGRLTGLLRTAVDGRGDVALGTVLGVLVLALGVMAGREVRRCGLSTSAFVLGATAVVLVVARSFVAEGDGAGFFVAMPVLALGIGAWSWKSAGLAERAVVVFVATNVALVLATQYAEGGGAEWGGRYLFFALVPAMVVTLAALRRGLDETGGGGPAASRARIARRANIALILLILVPTLIGIAVTGRAVRVNDAQARRTAEAEGDTVVLLNRFVGRWGWRDLPEADRLFAEPEDAGALLERLRLEATGPITVLGGGAEEVRADGYERESVAPSEVVFRPVERDNG